MREREHLERVANLGCVVCLENGQETPAEIHHTRQGRGLTRSGPFETIPLCHYHHRTGGYGIAFHDGKKSWERNYGTEADLLAKTLKLIYGDNYGTEGAKNRPISGEGRGEDDGSL